MQLQVGSRWTDAEGQLFCMIELGEGSNPWVHYQNIKTGQDYTCLAEAFQHRFQRIDNDSRA